jgi:hypothetical protein
VHSPMPARDEAGPLYKCTPAGWSLRSIKPNSCPYEWGLLCTLCRRARVRNLAGLMASPHRRPRCAHLFVVSHEYSCWCEGCHTTRYARMTVAVIRAGSLCLPNRTSRLRTPAVFPQPQSAVRLAARLDTGFTNYMLCFLGS